MGNAQMKQSDKINNAILSIESTLADLINLRDGSFTDQHAFWLKADTENFKCAADALWKQWVSIADEIDAS